MFGPPEVITGRLMSGAGATPMMAASTQFTAAALAYEMSSDRMMTQMAYLGTAWRGDTGLALQRTVTGHLAWMRVMQSQLVLGAARTAAQATAFTTAYTSMAQMPMITENRVTTAVLHATNFLGMNTPAIGVREGQYAEMWAQDVAVQSAYFSATVANTTFEPFLPGPPLAGVSTFPPLISQAINAAAGAGETVMLAANNAAAAAGVAKGQVGLAMGMAGDQGLQANAAGRQAEAQAAVARMRANQGQQEGQQESQQMSQQLLQQLPQQAAQLGQLATQLPQQALQQVQQIPQQISQFGSQIGQLMSQVSPDLQLDNPGFFDTQPSSSTLDRLSGGGGAAGMTALARVPNLAGLSGNSTGFRFPNGWDGVPLAPAPPPPATGAPASGMGAGRGMGGMMNPMRRRRDDESSTRINRDTELAPIWGGEPEDPETVSPGELLDDEAQEAAR